jgi:hypothetical protein
LQYTKTVLEGDVQYNKAQNRWNFLASRIGVLLHILLTRGACKFNKNLSYLRPFCPSVHLQQLGSNFMVFVESICWRVLIKLSTKLNFCWNGQSNEHFTRIHIG